MPGQLALFKNNNMTIESWRNSIVEYNKMPGKYGNKRVDMFKQIAESDQMTGFDERVYSPSHTKGLQYVTYPDTLGNDWIMMGQGPESSCKEFRGPVAFEQGRIADNSHEYVAYHFGRIKHLDSSAGILNKSFCRNFSKVLFYLTLNESMAQQTLRKIAQRLIGESNLDVLRVVAV